MNIKQTVVLLILAVALSLAALWYGRHEEKVVASAAAENQTVVEGVTSGTIERIEIVAPGAKAVNLTRSDDTWYTDAEKKHRAEKNAVNNIFAALEKPIEGEVVSEKKESQADYEVDETSGTHVTMYKAGGEVAADFFIGKDGGAAFTSFVRKAKDNKIINANQSLSYLFKKPNGWRDKAIFALSSDAIGAFAAEGTSGTFELQKLAGTWTLTKPENRKADAGKVSTILSMVSNLATNEFVETTQPLSELGLDPPRQKFTITHEDNDSSPTKTASSILLVGNKRSVGTDYYAKKPDSDTIYSVSEYTVKALTPELKDLAPPPPAPEPETTATETAAPQTTATEAKETEAQEAAPATTATQAAETAATSAPAAAVTPAPTPEPAATPAPATATPPPTETVTTTATETTTGTM